MKLGELISKNKAVDFGSDFGSTQLLTSEYLDRGFREMYKRGLDAEPSIADRDILVSPTTAQILSRVVSGRLALVNDGKSLKTRYGDFRLMPDDEIEDGVMYVVPPTVTKESSALTDVEQSLAFKIVGFNADLGAYA